MHLAQYASLLQAKTLTLNNLFVALAIIDTASFLPRIILQECSPSHGLTQSAYLVNAQTELRASR